MIGPVSCFVRSLTMVFWGRPAPGEFHTSKRQHTSAGGWQPIRGGADEVDRRARISQSSAEARRLSL